ncbi:Cell cycle control protein 50A [Geodia barretti]|uniref:Cell cycle control protein 50A n=1 Tax=Geodia barretti TaxID=519541 RepID=A0AA35WJZ4_GEOBA|nr:Cell cycle control protein 50A [Geodia barretti]
MFVSYVYLPANKWLQQQIPACRPVFTAKYVFGLFIIVGILFLILGIVFVAATVGLRELEVEYTNCGPLETDNIQASSCEDYLRNISDISNSNRRNTGDCHCTLVFEVKDTMRYPWKFYYALDNYYQNHRRYLNSWDPAQLRGDNFRSPDSNCRPLVRYRDNDNEMNNASRLPIVPCGIIANSWFNDSFHYLHNEELNETIDLSRNNIAWKTDREVRFRNDSNLAADLEGTNRPPNWPYNVSEIGDGLGNESLIVWFRASAFPWFRKLYAHPRGDTDLRPGNYSLLITYNYPVDNSEDVSPSSSQSCPG